MATAQSQSEASFAITLLRPKVLGQAGNVNSLNRAHFSRRSAVIFERAKLAHRSQKKARSAPTVAEFAMRDTALAEQTLPWSVAASCGLRNGRAAFYPQQTSPA